MPEKSKLPSIRDLLAKDNPKIEAIKTLLDREEEYSFLLGSIEFPIAEQYVLSKSLTDKEVISHLKHILENYEKKLSFFEDDFDKKIIASIIGQLLEDKTTFHELKLAFNYVIWTIDNRNWMGDSQAYVKWITFSMGLFDKKEEEKYKIEFKKKALRLGVPAKQIDALLEQEYDSLEVDDKDRSKIESEFFALEESEKFDFVVRNFIDYAFLADIYGFQLEEDGNFVLAEKFYKKILEIIPEFPPLEFSLGLVYNQLKNPHLAEHHFRIALNSLDAMSEDILPKEQIVGLKKEINKELKKLS